MDEQFILRVPPSVAERIERLLNENPSSSDDKSLDVSFSEDGRTGTFVIGNDSFPASLLDLPCVVESYKTYDDSVLIKAADVGQFVMLFLCSFALMLVSIKDVSCEKMIMVQEPDIAAPDAVEYKHGLTPPMRDARKRRFRREPDLNPELVRRVEENLLTITAGVSEPRMLRHRYIVSLEKCLQAEPTEQEKDGEAKARNANKKPAPPPVAKLDVPEAVPNAGEPDRSDSDESDETSS
ncbi:hypothetical protein TIFTF001_001972 [Ficus carica]|uniref:TAFII55 protein conserved region domain-containing protein n=1 Tax=Ficus carica TaxID=3494 RepID=A0AA88CRB9_FICCA|nr:hypothetical protein TIFTF001_001972 [Ficus carica]